MGDRENFSFFLGGWIASEIAKCYFEVPLMNTSILGQRGHDTGCNQNSLTFLWKTCQLMTQNMLKTMKNAKFAKIMKIMKNMPSGISEVVYYSHSQL